MRHFGFPGVFPGLMFLGLLLTNDIALASPPGKPVLASFETPIVTGSVTDSSGRPLANVNVLVAPIGRTTTTNEEGNFVLRALPAGSYHLTVFMLGFAPSHHDISVLDGGQAIALSIRLRPTTIQLSVVQVTATPIASDPRSVSQSTAEITGQALSRNLGNSVAQTLSREPGINQRYAGPAANTPVIRGLSGERILVLQDGQRAGDLSSTSKDHSLSIDPLSAQRIEVVRGPASLLYGNNALGGVVNVISNDIPTSLPSHNEGYLAGQTESATPGGAFSGSIAVPVGTSIGLLARAGIRQVGDLRQGGGATLSNTYFDNKTAVVGAGYVGEQASAGFAWRGYSFDYGLPTPPGDDEAGVHIKGRRKEITGSTDLHFGPDVLRSLRLNAGSQWYVHDEIESSGEVATTFNLKTQTADALARTGFGSVSGAVGVSLLLKQYQPTGEEALTPAANSTSYGAFVYQDIPLRESSDPDALVPRIQVGGRYDTYKIDTNPDDSKFGSATSLTFNNVSGSLGLSLPLSATATFAVSAARAFRAPTVEELFSNAFHAANGTYDVGNRSLKAETNQGFDGVLRLASGTVNGQFSAYYNRVANFIVGDIAKDTVVDGESVPLNRFIQSDATLKGVEGRIEAEVAPHFVLGAMGDLVRGDLVNGEPVPFIPAARLGALARWDNASLAFDLEAIHSFEQNRVPPTASSDDPSGIATGSYTLVNLSLGYRFARAGVTHSVTLRADNLLDTQCREATSRIKNFAFNPGRNLAAVYKVFF